MYYEILMFNCFLLSAAFLFAAPWLKALWRPPPFFSVLPSWHTLVRRPLAEDSGGCLVPLARTTGTSVSFLCQRPLAEVREVTERVSGLTSVTLFRAPNLVVYG